MTTEELSVKIEMCEGMIAFIMEKKNYEMMHIVNDLKDEINDYRQIIKMRTE